MGLLASIGWAVVLVIAFAIGYAVACAVVLSVVRPPDDGPVVLLEEALFVLTLPFVAAVVFTPALRR